MKSSLNKLFYMRLLLYKTTMKKINDLVKLADKVQKQQGCLKTEQEKKKKITKSICSK